MESLRWWLLLMTALMFSMSGCASERWTILGSPAPVVFDLEREPQ